MREVRSAITAAALSLALTTGSASNALAQLRPPEVKGLRGAPFPSMNPPPDVRSYAEIAYSYHTDGGAEPWEIQFGLEFAPPCPTGIYGAPFVAVNALLQQEHDFGGMFTAQAGWAWRNAVGRLFRAGLHYHNGTSPQYEFFNRHEEQIGVGIWYDY